MIDHENNDPAALRADYDAMTPIVMFAVFLATQGSNPTIAKAAFAATVFSAATAAIKYVLARRAHMRAATAG